MFESIAYAASNQGGSAPAEANPLISFLPFILIFFVMYFFMIRPQQKRQQELQRMIDAIKKGDRVVTTGGLLGTVAGIQNDYVVLKVGDSENTKIEVLKSAITGLRKD